MAAENPAPPARRPRKRRRRAASYSTSSSEDSDSSEDETADAKDDKMEVDKASSSSGSDSSSDSSSESSESSDSDSSESSDSSDSDSDSEGPAPKRATKSAAREVAPKPRQPTLSPSPPPRDIPSFLANAGEEDDRRARFRRVYMDKMVEGFGGDLETMRTNDPTLGPSRLQLLIDSLAAGVDVFADPDGEGKRVDEVGVILNETA